jgi:hypothetical protein
MRFGFAADFSSTQAEPDLASSFRDGLALWVPIVIIDGTPQM